MFKSSRSGFNTSSCNSSVSAFSNLFRFTLLYKKGGYWADTDLVCINASHLFAASTTKIGFRKGTFLRTYMYEFIERFAPHLTKELVERASLLRNQDEVDDLFKDIELPVR